MQATVRDAMSSDVVSVPRHTSIDDAERLLVQHGLDELFVTSEQGLLLGTLPDYELLKRRLTDVLQPSKTVESLMSRRFLVISVESPLTAAIRYLREHIHHRLVVVDDMRLVGQVTRRAVLQLLSVEASDTNPQPGRQAVPRPKMLSAARRSQSTPTP